MHRLSVSDYQRRHLGFRCTQRQRSDHDTRSILRGSPATQVEIARITRSGWETVCSTPEMQQEMHVYDGRIRWIEDSCEPISHWTIKDSGRPVLVSSRTKGALIARRKRPCIRPKHSNPGGRIRNIHCPAYRKTILRYDVTSMWNVERLYPLDETATNETEKPVLDSKLRGAAI
jgi:hypothetical protein